MINDQRTDPKGRCDIDYPIAQLRHLYQQMKKSPEAPVCSFRIQFVVEDPPHNRFTRCDAPAEYQDEVGNPRCKAHRDPGCRIIDSLADGLLAPVIRHLERHQRNCRTPAQAEQP